MLCLNLTTTGQTPVGTGFTYQGLLREASQPATGAYDIHVSLWDAATGGAQVGGAQCFDDVAVNDGLFTVQPDFGAQFDGNQRFVQIAVRPAGAAGDCAVGGYTVLTPRQALTATPYAATALRALDVVGADRHSLDAADGSPTDAVFVNNDGNVGIGTTTPAAKLEVNGDIGIAADNEIRFADNGQIVAGDDNHQIRFRRSENILEFREIGRFVFKPGLLSTLPHKSEFRVVIDQYARVGIGIDVPTQQLDVLGDALIRGRQYFVVPGQVATLNIGNESNSIRGIFGSGLRPGVFQVPDAVAIQEVSGNFGIGTSSPTRKLDVAGDAIVRGSTFSQAGDRAGLTLGVNGIEVAGVYGSGLRMSAFGAPDAVTIQENTGRVGIGTTTPASRLSVAGNADISGALAVSSGAMIGGILDVDGAAMLNSTLEVGGVLTATDHVFIDGNVGIGTTTPNSKLSVAGAADVQDTLQVTPSFEGGEAALLLDRYYISGNDNQLRSGRVAGFLTLDAIQVYANGDVSIDGLTTIAGPASIFGSTAIVGELSVTNPLQTPHIKAVNDLYIEKGLADLNDQWLRVYTWDQAAQREQFRIQDGVNADVKADGTFLSNGLDYAEAFKTDDASIEAGDVVCLQIGNWENCQKSTQAYSQNIIGVVSNQAGFICGMSFDAENEADAEIARLRDEARNNMALARQNNDENAYNAAVAEEKRHTQALLAKVQKTHRPVALVGRVPCKIDGRFGPIRAGDRLTASPTPGCAMKQTQPGPSIGVALEDWDGSGIGRVMTFVQPGWYGSSATPTAVTAGEVSTTELAATVAALQAEVARLRESLSNGKR